VGAIVRGVLLAEKRVTAVEGRREVVEIVRIAEVVVA
jgi:hypothetical protein